MKALLTLLLLSIVCSIKAQTIYYDYEAKTYGSSYNPLTGEITPLGSNPYLHKGSSVNYWLVNVNPYGQKVEVNGSLISLTTNMPDQLATLFNIKVEAEKALDNTQNQVDKMAEVNHSAKDKALKTTTDSLVTACTDYYVEAQKIKETLGLHQRLVETLTDKSFSNASSMGKALETRKVNSAEIGSLRANFERFEEAYQIVYKQYQRSIDAAHKIGDEDKEARIASAQEQVQKDYNALYDKYEKTLASIDDLFAKATNPSSYIVKSYPIKLDGNGENADEVEFIVKVGEQGFEDVLPVYGGWKIDYSVGPVFNFISDHKYFLDSGDTLRRGNTGTILNTITPSVAAMMHVCRRTYKDYTFGGMFGLNAGFKELTDINLGFLAGVTAILGRSQKAIISTGASYLKVNRLKEGQYTVGKYYPEVKIEDVTESVLRPSWFIAISLNIGKRHIIKPTFTP